MKNFSGIYISYKYITDDQFDGRTPPPPINGKYKGCLLYTSRCV